MADCSSIVNTSDSCNMTVANWSNVVMESVPDAAYIGLCVYISMVTTLALLSNGLFLTATLKSKSLQQPIHYMLRNLAVADVCSAAFGGSINIASNANKSFFFGKTVCYVEGFLVGTFGIVNLTSICLLSISRYLVICKPFGSFTLTKMHARFAAVFAWIWALSWNLPQLVMGGYELEGIGTNCGPVWNTEDPNARAYLICFVTFCFFGTVSILAGCYGKIVLTLRKTRRASSIHSTKSLKAEKNVTNMVVHIMVAFLTCWTAYTGVAIYAICNPGETVNRYFGTIPVYFAKSSTLFNPIIYVLLNKRIRKEVFKILHLTYRENEDSSSGSIEQRPLNERQHPAHDPSRDQSIVKSIKTTTAAE